jgi:hypothetical protein
MRGNPVGWFEIYVDDMPRAQTFYETVLDVRLEPLGDSGDTSLRMLSFPSSTERYGCGGALVYVEGAATGGNSTVVYFACEDCAVEESRVAGAGGSIDRRKLSIGPYGFVSLVVDTEGNRIGLHSMR